MDTGVIYARFSSQSQNEQSIEAQIRICSEFVENRGIDHLVSQVFVSNDDTVVCFNIRGGKNIAQITLNDTKEAMENNIKSVRMLTSLLHQMETRSNPWFFFICIKGVAGIIIKTKKYEKITSYVYLTKPASL